VKTMTISAFKAHALRVIDDVASSHEGLIITKRRKPIVQVIPYEGDTAYPVPGRLADAFVREIDIVSPVGSDAWEAAR
jgi:antitoxin (DNA-binding transcriptional repressor) of toxin-antitoxin stability system